MQASKQDLDQFMKLVQSLPFTPEALKLLANMDEVLATVDRTDVSEFRALVASAPVSYLVLGAILAGVIEQPGGGKDDRTVEWKECVQSYLDAQKRLVTALDHSLATGEKIEWV